VDFKTVKTAVNFEQVLTHYQVNWLRKSGDELRGRCPIHQGERKGFHVNLAKGAFRCFSDRCKAKGNLLDFVAAMEKCTVRDAALKLQAWFSIGGASPTSTPATPDRSGGKGSGDELVNKPLTFQLKGVDPAHAYLAERGITRETAEAFGVGFF